MTLEDYLDIDFRDVNDGKICNRIENDVSNVLIDDDRLPSDNEVKVAVYIFNDDYYLN